MQFDSHIEVTQKIVSEKIHRQNKVCSKEQKLFTDANNIVNKMIKRLHPRINVKL